MSGFQEIRLYQNTTNTIPGSFTDITSTIIGSATDNSSGGNFDYDNGLKTVSGLSAGTQYWFWIECIDAAGNTSGIQSLGSITTASPAPTTEQAAASFFSAGVTAAGGAPNYFHWFDTLPNVGAMSSIAQGEPSTFYIYSAVPDGNGNNSAQFRDSSGQTMIDYLPQISNEGWIFAYTSAGTLLLGQSGTASRNLKTHFTRTGNLTKHLVCLVHDPTDTGQEIKLYVDDNPAAVQTVSYPSSNGPIYTNPIATGIGAPNSYVNTGTNGSWGTFGWSSSAFSPTDVLNLFTSLTTSDP